MQKPINLATYHDHCMPVYSATSGPIMR